MSDPLEEAAALVERLFQRRDRLFLAQLRYAMTDPTSLDRPGVEIALEAARQMFTASKFELAERITDRVTPPSDTLPNLPTMTHPNNDPAEEPVLQAGDELRDPTTAAGGVPAIMGRDALGELPLAARAALELTRQHTQVTAALAAMNWGKGMTAVTRRAATAWCERFGVEPMVELDVLGGNFYLTSEFYIRKLIEARDSGLVVDFWQEHIHNDERLYHTAFKDESAPDDVREQARILWYRAMFKRTEFNVPEAAAAACVTYIRLKGQEHVIQACKWGGNGTSVIQPRRSGAGNPNPVVESNPELSVESQSLRRAMRLVSSHVTTQLNTIERALVTLSEEQHDELLRAEEVRERVHTPAPPVEPRALPPGHGYDEIPVGLKQGQKGEPVRVVVEKSNEAPPIGLADTMGDVMGEG